MLNFKQQHCLVTKWVKWVDRKTKNQFRKSQSYNFACTIYHSSILVGDFALQAHRVQLLLMLVVSHFRLARYHFFAIWKLFGKSKLLDVYPGKSQIAIKSYQTSFSFARTLSSVRRFLSFSFFFTISTSCSCSRCSLDRFFTRGNFGGFLFVDNSRRPSTKHAREAAIVRAAYPFDNMEQSLEFSISFACASCMCSWLSTSRPYFPFQTKEVVMLYLDLIQSIELLFFRCALCREREIPKFKRMFFFFLIWCREIFRRILSMS